jgi:hypothetical protein
MSWTPAIRKKEKEGVKKENEEKYGLADDGATFVLRFQRYGSCKRGW